MIFRAILLGIGLGNGEMALVSRDLDKNRSIFIGNVSRKAEKYIEIAYIFSQNPPISPFLCDFSGKIRQISHKFCEKCPYKP